MVGLLLYLSVLHISCRCSESRVLCNTFLVPSPISSALTAPMEKDCISQSCVQLIEHRLPQLCQACRLPPDKLHFRGILLLHQLLQICLCLLCGLRIRHTKGDFSRSLLYQSAGRITPGPYGTDIGIDPDPVVLQQLCCHLRLLFRQSHVRRTFRRPDDPGTRTSGHIRNPHAPAGRYMPILRNQRTAGMYFRSSWRSVSLWSFHQIYRKGSLHDPPPAWVSQSPFPGFSPVEQDLNILLRYG